MRVKTFTLLFSAFLFYSISSFAQADAGTGMEWGGGAFFPSTDLVLNENFQGFTFFHSDDDPNSGNSNNSYDPGTGAIVYGYTNDTTEVLIEGSTSAKIKYYFDQCAFAPDWATASAFNDDGDNSGNSNTPNVTNGFVEVSRDYHSDPPTIAGSFVVDLSALDYVDGIQWTHSSCGGNKRGVLLEFSTDMGENWDTLRYQGSNGRNGWTKDINSGLVTENLYNCQPSAYGMTWEDGIYYSATEENPLWLRFMVSDGQVPRIHDLRIYGTYTEPTSSADIKAEDLKVYSFNKEIHISEEVNVKVYNINGMVVKSAEKTNLIPMTDMSNGIYLVKTQMDSKIKTTKVLIK